MSEIVPKTVENALMFLDMSYQDIWTKRVGVQRESQMSYYTGQKMMLELVLSDVYKKDVAIKVTLEGKHYVENNEEKVS